MLLSLRVTFSNYSNKNNRKEIKIIRPVTITISLARHMFHYVEFPHNCCRKEEAFILSKSYSYKRVQIQVSCIIFPAFSSSRK